MATQLEKYRNYVFRNSPLNSASNVPDTLIVENGRLTDLHPRVIQSDEWIWACSVQKQSQPDLDSILKMWNSIKKNSPNQRDLDNLAINYNYRSAKFIIFSSQDSCVPVWTKIRDCTIQGELGSMSRISRSKSGNRYIVYVSVEDYLDIDDIYQIKFRLNQLGFQKLALKPDIYTLCSIYSKNQWGISPTIDL